MLSHVRSHSCRFGVTLAVVAACLAIAGCVRSARYAERPLFVCSVPVPECHPDSYTAWTVDTVHWTSGGADRLPFRMAIDVVGGLDEKGREEFGLAFIDSRQALATIRDERERLYQVELEAVDQARVGPQLEVGSSRTDGALGSAAVGSAAVADGGHLLLTAHLATRVSGDYDLFAAPRSGAAVGPAQRLDVSSVFHWDSQPTISSDGSLLFFASDRRGGYGGTDIYVSRRRPDGSWSRAVNAGAGVNTPCDEISPFISTDGRWLYFSSSGHETVGGYDLFRAPIAGGEVGGARNLGRPINTPADEIFPATPPGASGDTLLYYSSDQRRRGDFDLFVLHRVTTTRRLPAAMIVDSVRLVGTVRFPGGAPVDSAIVSIHRDDLPSEVDSMWTDPQGNYEFVIIEGRRYRIIAGVPGRLPADTTVELDPSNERRRIVRDLVIPDTVRFRVNFPSAKWDSPYEFTLDDRGLPTDERWRDVIDRFARFLGQTQVGPDQLFEIVGHTDPVGTEESNMTLGRRRAEFVRSQLIARGVPASILEVRSEGESNPLPRRAGESTETYYARLRRVELVRMNGR